MSDMSEAPNAFDRAKASPRPEQNFDLLSGVSLRVSVEVGSASIKLVDLLNFAEGSVVELDRQANDLLDIFANGTLIAKGEIVTVDNRYGVRIVEIVAAERRFAGIERRV
jgi:flagellar motor switch protein FliN/FliY